VRKSIGPFGYGNFDHMNNPYYATGFFSALFFWVWPAFLYKTLDANWPTVIFFSALLILGAGRAATEIHIHYITSTAKPRARTSSIVVVCLAIVAAGLLTRVGYHSYMAA
jgi:hypothetical protein